MSDAVVKQRASVYTVMLVVSWLCLSVACAFLYAEMNQFEFSTKVPDEIRAKNAQTEAEKATTAAPPPVEPDMMDPAANPMPMPMDPANPMPMPMPMDPANPMPMPMANPAMPAEPAVM